MDEIKIKKFSVPADKIIFVESNLHKLIYHVLNDKDVETEIEVYGKLNELEEEYEKYRFCRVHQSYLVNIKYIDKICRYRITLFDGAQLNVSKRRYMKAKNDLVKYQKSLQHIVF